MPVMQQTVKHGAHGGRIAQQFAPVFQRPVRGQHGRRVKKLILAAKQSEETSRACKPRLFKPFEFLDQTGWDRSLSALRNTRLAASASRNADSRKSMVAPLESMARYK